MTAFDSKNKWQKAVERTLSIEKRKSRVLQKEWQNFSESEINLLLQLREGSIPYNSIIETSPFTELIQNGSKNFLLQCLSTTIINDKTHSGDKLVPLFYKIDEWIDVGVIRSIDKITLHHSILSHLVENEAADALKEILSIISPSLRVNSATPNAFNKYPEDNNVVLMMACRKNMFELVYPFVCAGYR